MESTDQKILSLLARDGRMSYTDIGRETGLSTSAAQQRVRRLEHRGVIEGYRAVINPEALGKVLTAFISLRPFDPADDAGVVGVLDSIPAITSCFKVAGESAFLISAEAESPAALETLLADVRNRARCSTHTTLVLSVPFRDRPLL